MRRARAPWTAAACAAADARALHVAPLSALPVRGRCAPSPRPRGGSSLRRGSGDRAAGCITLLAAVPRRFVCASFYLSECSTLPRDAVMQNYVQRANVLVSGRTQSTTPLPVSNTSGGGAARAAVRTLTPIIALPPPASQPITPPVPGPVCVRAHCPARVSLRVEGPLSRRMQCATAASAHQHYALRHCQNYSGDNVRPVSARVSPEKPPRAMRIALRDFCVRRSTGYHLSWGFANGT